MLCFRRNLSAFFIPVAPSAGETPSARQGRAHGTRSPKTARLRLDCGLTSFFKSI